MIRLDKYLCEMEAGTRSEVKAFIKKGRVTVNGETAKSPEQKVDETKDTVTLDGHSFSYQKYFYYMLHKAGRRCDRSAGSITIRRCLTCLWTLREKIFPRLDGWTRTPRGFC